MLLKKKYIKHLETELTKATSLRDYYYGRVIELEKENAHLKRRMIDRLFTMVENRERGETDVGQDQQL